jgi:hypothetical protein
MIEDIVIVKMFESVINSMEVPNITINYQPGRSLQILKSINDLDNSTSLKDLKYPLIAILLPIREQRGSSGYVKCIVPRIVIATLTKSGTGSENVLPRYDEDGNFKSILYPCYNEFMNQLAQSQYTIFSDPDRFVHIKMDNPGQQPIGEGSSDYIDSVEILNLEIILNQIKTC